MQPTPSRRRTLQLAGTAAAVGLAGCLFDGTTGDNGSDDVDAAGTLGSPAERVEIRIRSVPQVKIEPGIVHIEPGGTVEWVAEGFRNRSTAYHPETFGPQRIPDGADPWQSGLLREGAHFEVELEQEGIYDYADSTRTCGTHEALGGVGRIVVGWPTPDGEPAIEHEDASLPSVAGVRMGEYTEKCLAVL